MFQFRAGNAGHAQQALTCPRGRQALEDLGLQKAHLDPGARGSTGQVECLLGGAPSDQQPIQVEPCLKGLRHDTDPLKQETA